MENKIEHIKQNGYELSFNETFSDAWATFKGVFGYGALAIVIYFAVSMIIGSILSALFGVSGLQTEMMEKATRMGNNASFSKLMDIYSAFFLSTEYISMQIVSVLTQAVIFPLLAGVIYISYKYDSKGSVDVSDVFYGYQGSNFIKLISYYLISTILVSIAFIFLVLPSIYLSVALCIGVPFILFHNQSPIEAMKSSITVINKKWGTVFLLLIVSGIVGLSGFLGCCIGVVLTMPFIYTMIYTIYKKSVGVSSKNEIESIGQS